MSEIAAVSLLLRKHILLRLLYVGKISQLASTLACFNLLFLHIVLFIRPWKPRPVAPQVTQQFASPTQPKKEKKEKMEKDKNEREPTLKKNSHKKMRPRLKNVDRSSAQHLEVTVGDLTVIITDFKEKTKPSSSSSSSAASGDHHSQSGSNSDNTEKGISRSSSPRGEGSSLNGESH
ncbi:YY1-associated factor 2-like isoform X1 [Sinocyclocheilus rhinocerous]|uniref:YY1-associated factor 2-like isoform X1 n=1 Tax=Sinocyclocheilus rhinocerous TaxID=307959 RepID=UPI0007B87EE0|nr:PREDICTED: YY1-associated factor 2-like isoform X1 [Sinocyclocheilus rhinocerous]